MLGAIPNALPREAKPPLDVPSTDTDATTRRNGIIRQTLEHSCLSGTIDTEKCETLTLIQTERDVIDSGQVPAEASLEYFLESIDADRHVFTAQSGNSLLLLEDISVFHLGVGLPIWQVPIGILDLPACRPETALEDAVEGAGPTVAIDDRFEEDDQNYADSEVCDQGPHITQLVIHRPSVQVDLSRIVQQGIIHAAE